MRTSLRALGIGLATFLAACDDGGSSGSGGSGGATSTSGATTGNGTGGAADVTPPSTTVVAAPGDEHSAARASTFELACSEQSCTWECSLDGGPFEECTSTPSFDGLALGAHTLSVRATDPAGNVEAPPKEHAWALVFGWRAVAVASSSACAIGWDHRLYTWGSDQSELLGDGPLGAGSRSQPAPVGDAANWESVFAGYDGFCARNSAAEVHCWGEAGPVGDVNYGEDPEPTLRFTGVVKLSANYDLACGIDAAGKLSCVGFGAEGQLGDGNLAPHYQATFSQVGADSYVDVSVGDDHVCAVRADGQLVCWGAPPLASSPTAAPKPVDNAADWASVSAGPRHTCATKTTGTLYCWGRGDSGQLGQGSVADHPAPAQVGTETDWQSVSTAEDSTCAVKTDGRAYCWGRNDEGQLGSTSAPLTQVSTPTPAGVGVAFDSIHGAAQLRCGETRDGFVRCWGSNYAGALGRSVEEHQSTMALLDMQFDSISQSAESGGCGVAAGKLLCWGYGPNAQPDRQALPSPTQIGVENDWTQVSVSMSYPGHACGLRGQHLYCWGDNTFGQIGNGANTPAQLPTEITSVGVGGWTHVAAGAYETCALTSAGEIYCWGYNSYGNLGIGSTINQNTPQKVPGGGWDSVDLGHFRGSAHKSDGTVWNWGVNSSTTPAQLPGNDWAKIGATGFAECAIKTAGTLHCTLQAVPGIFQIGVATNWVDNVRVGSPFCALDDQGAVACFVNNGSNNGFVSSPAIEPDNGWLALGHGDGISCGLKAGHARYCRGRRHLGSLGDGFDERAPTLVSTPSF